MKYHENKWSYIFRAICSPGDKKKRSFSYNYIKFLFPDDAKLNMYYLD